MDNKEVEKVLEELQEVRPEKLTGDAKRLFEAIMIIVDGRDKAEADLYEANNCISDLLDVAKEKDRIIDEMAKEILLKYQLHYKTVDDIRKIYEERCNNAED